MTHSDYDSDDSIKTMMSKFEKAEERRQQNWLALLAKSRGG